MIEILVLMSENTILMMAFNLDKIEIRFHPMKTASHPLKIQNPRSF